MSFDSEESSTIRILFTNDDMCILPNGEFLNGAKTVVISRDENVILSFYYYFQVYW